MTSSQLAHPEHCCERQCVLGREEVVIVITEHRVSVGKIQESMKALRDASKKYQDELTAQRAQGDNVKVNLYQPGDSVLAQTVELLHKVLTAVKKKNILH